MKCPKCGYTSFDHLDSCKKCGKDLVEFKERYGIKGVLLSGQMSSAEPVEDRYDDEAADAVVAAAAVTAVTAAPAGIEEEATEKQPESDDFGFDFMGDSASDDDLSFDELFEEAPEDEDIEETIEAPKQEADSSADEGFSFDLSEDDEELDNDFGFDLGGEEDEDAEVLDDADEESPFDEDDGDDEEDSKSPFDLPESSEVEGAPGTETVYSVEAPESDNTGFEVVTAALPAAAEPHPVAAEEPADAGDGADISEETAEEDPAGPVPPVALEDESKPEGVPATAAFDNGTGDLMIRVTAFVCDFVVLCLVGGSFIVVAEAAMSTESVRVLPTLETLIDLSVPYFLVLFSLAFGYFTLFHFLAGQTPGKMLAGIRVETTGGEPLTFAHAFLRSVGGLLQSLPLGLGYLTVLANAERRGWNDRLAGTRVIKLKDLAEGV